MGSPEVAFGELKLKTQIMAQPRRIISYFSAPLSQPILYNWEFFSAHNGLHTGGWNGGLL